jgi:mono/diheme cytochrome c family protein
MLNRHLFLVFIIWMILLSSISPVFAGGPEAAESVDSIKEKTLNDPGAIKKGETKFNSTCAYCHGSKGSGGKARKLQGRSLKPDYVFNVITNGKKRGSLNMPPWKKLSEEVRWQLTAYILWLGKIE